MKKANISYLRNHLSKVIAGVREGDSVVILDRDTPVARLEPYRSAPGGGSVRLDELERLGLVRRGLPDAQPLPAPLRTRKPVDAVALLLSERREGP